MKSALVSHSVANAWGEGAADAVFDYIYAVAGIDRLGGGMVLMDQLLGATPFLLPEGVPDEED
jgi:hypothetical protein